MVAPLKLKRERYGKPEINSNRPVLSVLVDTGIYHLDSEYDYLLSAKFEVEAGQWVSVPFRNQNLRGLVINRSAKSVNMKLSFINKPISGNLIDGNFLSLYRKIADRWAVPIFDVLRFVDRKNPLNSNENLLKRITIESSKKSPKRGYLQLSFLEDEISQVRKITEQLARTGSTLLIVPEARTAELLRSEFYEVGMRSAILQPKSFENILILREESEHHYEIRSPGFNTRDVALLRSELLKENLLFIGFAPSLDMSGLIAKGYVNLKQTRARAVITAESASQGELLPSKLLPKIKESLPSGPVLMMVPNKGYGLAISCSRCRNIAKCSCGGRFVKRSLRASFSCALCAKERNELRCIFCDSIDFKVLGKGIERIAEELGKSFPNRKIYISTAEKPFEGLVGKNSFLLSTVGMVPLQRFNQVVFLEGLGNSSDARGTERYISEVFRYLSYSSGKGLMVESPKSPVVNAAIRWDPFSLLERELDSLRSVGLPPSTRSMIILPSDSDSIELDQVASGLRVAINDGRLPKSFRFFNDDHRRISAFFSLKESSQVLGFVREFQRKRSIAGKKLLKIRVDPYRFG
jgi:primosomal protein N' (replication factor Y)